MTTPLSKGHALESQIGGFFELSGYAVRRNAILEGRSGGRHELDVLAEKSDGITTYQVVIECKAWQMPIEKDVVAKLDYIVRDLGLSKGIIVALAGWRTGAEQSARQLGIELWGRDEIETRLGRVALAGLETAPAGKTALGLALAVAKPDGISRIHGARKGAFAREAVTSVDLMWVPFYVLEIGCSKAEGLMKRTLKTRRIRNLYEGISGQFSGSFAAELTEVHMENAIQPRIRDSKIVSTIEKTFKKMQEVVTPSAKARYQSQVAQLGLPTDVHSIGIDSRQDVYLPFYVGLMEKGGRQRVMAVEAFGGRITRTISDVLTANLSYVGDAFSSTSSSQGPPPRPDL